MKKRITALLLCLVMVFSLIPHHRLGGSGRRCSHSGEQ